MAAANLRTAADLFLRPAPPIDWRLWHPRVQREPDRRQLELFADEATDDEGPAS